MTILTVWGAWKQVTAESINSAEFSSTADLFQTSCVKESSRWRTRASDRATFPDSCASLTVVSAKYSDGQYTKPRFWRDFLCVSNSALLWKAVILFSHECGSSRDYLRLNAGNRRKPDVCRHLSLIYTYQHIRHLRCQTVSRHFKLPRVEKRHKLNY